MQCVTLSEQSQNGFSLALCLSCCSGRRHSFCGPRNAKSKPSFSKQGGNKKPFLLCCLFSVMWNTASLFLSFSSSPDISQTLSHQYYFNLNHSNAFYCPFSSQRPWLPGCHSGSDKEAVNNLCWVDIAIVAVE